MFSEEEIKQSYEFQERLAIRYETYPSKQDYIDQGIHPAHATNKVKKDYNKCFALALADIRERISNGEKISRP